MATASAQLFVECGFCLRRNENLKDPRLLPCGHIHCSECLDGTLESNKFIACPAPNCKQVLNDLVHELPEATIGSQKSAHICGVCKKKPATVYCTYDSCKKAFCPEHEKSHTDILPHHSTISIEEYSRLSRKHEKRVCSRHKNQPLVFGCRKCSQILCEDCDEPTDCLGAPHQMATIKTLFNEAKQEVEPYRAKAEKRKDELSAILKESERVLSTYREETQEILELVKSTRDEQIRVLKDKYEQLTSEITKQRKVTAEEIVKFRDGVVEEELSQLNMSLQRVVATLNNDHMVDVVQNCMKSKDDISSTVRKDLPGLSIEKGVGLKVKGGSEDIRAEIAAVHLNINIGRLPSAATAEPQPKQVDDVSLTESADQSTKMSGKDKKSKALIVEEDFDKVYYEFMRIIRVKDFQARILAKYGGQIHEREHPTDSRLIRIQITSHTPGEAAKMMDALNEMFYEINRSVHSHSTKLLYDGDKDKLAKALMKDIRDPSLGFIARLVTKEDIRIIGSIANMDRDVSIVESYISEYKQKHPAAAVTNVTQSDIALPNGTVVIVMEGDLTKMNSEAVVSSSRPDLAHNGGVSKAIAQACGQRFSAQGRQFIKTGGELKDGDTFVQPADGRMLHKGVRYIIHAIAPAKTTNITPLLVKTVRNALKEADSLQCRTVALPAICAGNMGVTLQTCAECYWTALVKYSTENPLPKIKQVLFVVDDPVMVLQIHQVMSSKSLGGTAASSGDTAASSGGAAVSSGGSGSFQQQTPSGQRKGYTCKRKGRRRAANVGKEDWDEELTTDVEKNHANGKKGTNHPAAAAKQTPSSVDVEQGASGWGGVAGVAQGFVSSLFGGSSASVDGIYDNQEVDWREEDSRRMPYSSDRTTTDPKDYSSNTSVSSQRGVGYRGDPSTTGVYGQGGNSANVPGAKDPYVPRFGAANLTAAVRGSTGSAAAGGASKPNDKECPICMDDFKDPVALPCSHKFCKVCVDQVVKTAKSNLCPTCRSPFRNAEGKQPIGGTMSTHRSHVRLPGYSHCGSITIMYNIPGGIQGPEHPNPGQRYTGTSRTAYLPDNTEGRRAEKLLRKAFNQRLVFTIGQSVTTGRDNCVVWNDIHHKTNISGGPSTYGYPDPDYLDRLIEDLRAKGITD